MTETGSVDTEALRERGLQLIDFLNDGSDNEEYKRGQVELLAYLTGCVCYGADGVTEPKCAVCLGAGHTSVAAESNEYLFFAKQAFDEVIEECAAALAAIERVRALHALNEGQIVSRDSGGEVIGIEPYRLCGECSGAWPCPTIAALSSHAAPPDAQDQSRAIRKLDNVRSILAGAQSSVADAMRELELASAAFTAAPARDLADVNGYSEQGGENCEQM